MEWLLYTSVAIRLGNPLPSNSIVFLQCQNRPKLRELAISTRQAWRGVKGQTEGRVNIINI